MIEWTKEDDQAAKWDGWALFSCDAPTGPPYQLQRIDSPEDGLPPRFEDDTDAWTWVFSKALEESVLHKKALKFLKENSIEEYQTIESWNEQYYING